ncbi:erythrocyte membrane protein PFEMP3 [Cryptosporidium ryanae]|uniref:erythrocyte membrane protein PFEMP3 n=1 Tax=Cryptosporidium ryanae TaxID=515981 RepID=UPI003519EE89|nr:erythrocyte membrane protein PFEMP3 [Cryptosporidium ryanae]
MVESGSPLGQKLRIRIKAEGRDDDENIRNKKRKGSVSFSNRNPDAIIEDSRAVLLLECNPPSLLRVDQAEVLSIKVGDNYDKREDAVEVMSEASIESHEILEYVDNIELEARKLVDKNNKSKFDKQDSNQLDSIKGIAKNNDNIVPNESISADVVRLVEESKAAHIYLEERNEVNSHMPSPITYNIHSQSSNTPVFIPPQPIQIAPNVVQQPPRTFAHSLLLSKEKFSTRSFYPSDPNLNSSYLQDIKPIPDSIKRLYFSDEHVGINEVDSEVNMEEISKKIPIVVPSCSNWFNMDLVHPIELDLLSPVFKNEVAGNKSDEKIGNNCVYGCSNVADKINNSVLSSEIISEYKMIRNEIIKLYREMPRQYLSVTECRRRIPFTGDVSFLLRLHSYLEFWGLINFQADIRTLPPRVRKLRDYKLDDLNASFKEKNPCFFTSKIDESTINNPFTNTLVVQCISCNKPCIYSYYILRAGIVNGISVAVLDRCVWCIRCYSEGRYPPILHAGHFVKVDIPVISSVNGPEHSLKAGVLGIATWSQEEVQRLIEGIEYYGDDWDSVSHHVGNKRTPQECVAYFIQLPIEEPFMRNVNPSTHTKLSFPFMDVSNPLMTQIALIASVVNPVVAASAAKSALDKILEIEGYKTCRNINETEFGTEILSNATSDRGNTGFLPQMVPRISSAMWPSSALLGEKAVQEVCSIALENAAKRAKDLAEYEMNEMKNLLPNLIDNTINRLELKLMQFKHLQSMVNEERNILEKRLETIKTENTEVMSKLINNKH